MAEAIQPRQSQPAGCWSLVYLSLAGAPPLLYRSGSHVVLIMFRPWSGERTAAHLPMGPAATARIHWLTAAIVEPHGVAGLGFRMLNAV